MPAAVAPIDCPPNEKAFAAVCARVAEPSANVSAIFVYCFNIFIFNLFFILRKPLRKPIGFFN
jgi:hypothetical protein